MTSLPSQAEPTHEVERQEQLDSILEGVEPRHRRVLNLLARGFRGVDVARMTGYRPETVSRLKRANELRLERLAEVLDAAAFADSDGEYRAALRQLRNEVGIEAHRELLASPNANARAKALQVLLDRTGVGPQAEVAHDHRHSGGVVHFMMLPEMRQLRAMLDSGEAVVLGDGPPPFELPTEHDP